MAPRDRLVLIILFQLLLDFFHSDNSVKENLCLLFNSSFAKQQSEHSQIHYFHVKLDRARRAVQGHSFYRALSPLKFDALQPDANHRLLGFLIQSD